MVIPRNLISMERYKV